MNWDSYLKEVLDKVAAAKAIEPFPFPYPMVKDAERLAKHCMELRVLLKYFYDNPDWDVNTDQIEDLLKKEVE